MWRCVGGRDHIQFFLAEQEQALKSQAILFRFPFHGDQATLRQLAHRFFQREPAFGAARRPDARDGLSAANARWPRLCSTFASPSADGPGAGPAARGHATAVRAAGDRGKRPPHSGTVLHLCDGPLLAGLSPQCGFSSSHLQKIFCLRSIEERDEQRGTRAPQCVRSVDEAPEAWRWFRFCRWSTHQSVCSVWVRDENSSKHTKFAHSRHAARWTISPAPSCHTCDFDVYLHCNLTSSQGTPCTS